ncbi:hypothetical protein FACS1894120_1590 [Clostridia bacterium]|nr:hypothetical protein FACS1894120_1590 [Clostridia bacterium]
MSTVSKSKISTILKRAVSLLTALTILFAAVPFVPELQSSAAGVQKYDSWTNSFVYNGSSAYLIDTKNNLREYENGISKGTLLANIVTVGAFYIDKTGFVYYAISKTGNLYMWGKNDKGYVGDGTGVDVDKPVAVMGGVRQVTCINGTVMAVNNKNNLYAWGLTEFLKDGYYVWGTSKFVDAGEGIEYSPVQLASGIRKVVYASSEGYYAIDTNNRLLAFFSIKVATTVTTKKIVGSKMVDVKDHLNVAQDGRPFGEKGLAGNLMPVLDNAKDAWRAGADMYVLDTNDNLRMFKTALKTEKSLEITSINKSGTVQSMVTRKVVRTGEVFRLGGIASVSIYGDEKGYHIFAITQSGTLVSWGTNPEGILGNGTAVAVDVAKDNGKTGFDKVVKIASDVVANGNGIALKSDGTVIAWGMDFANKVKNPKATVIGKGYRDVDRAGAYYKVDPNTGKISADKVKVKCAQMSDGILYKYDFDAHKFVKAFDKQNFKLRVPTLIK